VWKLQLELQGPRQQQDAEQRRRRYLARANDACARGDKVEAAYFCAEAQ
jgi:hypothetical protein